MIPIQLDAEALRVLGALVEKERTTPEYYPLSLNALTNACNQKSNRDPVMQLDEIAVDRAAERLRRLGLASQSAEGGRVLKHSHNLVGRLQLLPAETSLLAELILRGPQTPGELRGRAERMHHFADVAEVEAILAKLGEREPALVTRLPRQPGRKEARWAHLLGGQPATEAADAPAAAPTVTSMSSPSAAGLDERVARLEAEVRALRAEVARLGKELRSFTLAPEPEPGTDGEEP